MRLILSALFVTFGLLLPDQSQAQAGIAAENVAAFLDDYIPAQMQAHGIPGVAVSAVHGGEVLLAKGYGLANVETNRAMHPTETILTTASLGKAVTALAVLQLVDRGLIALDDDVRGYLSDPALIANIPHGVTFAQLLTHSDGFESRVLGSAAVSEDALTPLAENLITYAPRQIHRPGTYLTYGNFAANLAGHLVAEISGKSFEAYAAENIFAPLGMANTTFEQRLTPDYMARILTGYEHDGDHLMAMPHFFVKNAPEGGLRGTLEDLSRLMQALLSGGTLEGTEVLSAPLSATMLERQFGSDPRLPGISYGLLEHWVGDEVAFIRDGDGVGVRTRMILFPNQDFGLLVSYNAGENALRLSIADAIADALFEARSPATPTEPLMRSDVSGSYRPLQADTTSFAKSMFLFSQTVLVTQPQDHVIELTTGGLLGGDQSNPFGGFEGRSRWIEIAPLLFEAEGGSGRIAFQTDERGRVIRLISGLGYHSPFARLPWHESLPVQMLLLQLSAATLALFVAVSVIGLPVRALVRVIRKRPARPTGWAARLTTMYFTLAAAIFLLLLVRTIGVLYAIDAIAGLPNFVWGVSDDIRTVLDDMRLVPILGMPLAVLAAVAWWQAWWSLGWRLFASLAVLGYGGLLLSASYWNLIGFQV